MLLIILTAGVRLNERRSQTHGARCKFNYREEERVECERMNDNERTKLILLPASLCFCARETEREREKERKRGRETGRGNWKSKYLYDGSLFRPLINGREKRVGCNEGYQDSIL